VYDKTVRRRRAVLALLVVLSLILLTAYFGEAPGGRLHSVQRVFLTVVSPVQDGANKALKPVRDLFGWFGSTLHAKSQRDQLLKQNELLRRQAISNQADERSYRELLALYHLDTTQPTLAGYTPVTATVVDKSPNIWYATVTIDKGEADGVRVNDPVINGEGLVGKVTQAASDGAVVSLITDSSVGVTAEINATGAVGVVQPEVGDPGRLLLQYLPAGTPVSPGDYVVTAGTVSSQGDSLFPRGIAIGQVVSENERSPYKSVNVRPLADLHKLDTVQVLTYAPGSHIAALTRLAAGMAPGRQAGPEAPPAGQLASTGTGG
jgi:rod shape-determining protein MreC